MGVQTPAVPEIHRRRQSGQGESESTPSPSLGLRAADGDQVEAFRASLEGAHDGRGDADDVPRADVADLVVEPYAAGAGDDHVGLLLLAVRVRRRAAEVRRVAPVADAEVARVEVLAAEAALHAVDAVADVVGLLEQVDDRVVGHSAQLPAVGAQFDGDVPAGGVGVRADLVGGADDALGVVGLELRERHVELDADRVRAVLTGQQRDARRIETSPTSSRSRRPTAPIAPSKHAA